MGLEDPDDLKNFALAKDLPEHACRLIIIISNLFSFSLRS